MDICEDREAAKPLIFCVVARDGMTSKVGPTLRKRPVVRTQCLKTPPKNLICVGEILNGE